MPRLSNPFSTPETKRIYDYVASFGRGDSNRIISGQHINDDGESASTGFSTYITPLSSKPLIIGVSVSAADLSSHITTCAAAHASGHIITADAHWANPFDGDDSWVADANAAKPDLYRLVPGSSTFNSTDHNALKVIVDKSVVFLEAMRARSIPVIWRPFHESNADWFWWGTDNNDLAQASRLEFLALWNWLYNYLTGTKGLNNLIWCYSSAVTYNNGSGNSSVTRCPNLDQVDLLGYDRYSDDLNYYLSDSYKDWGRLRRLGKPLCLSEIGNLTVRDGTHDNVRLLNGIKARYPEACFFQQWHSWTNNDVALVDCQNASSVLTDPWVVTLEDKLNSGSRRKSKNPIYRKL